jgi:putative hydrolase of the HAD superfamily
MSTPSRSTALLGDERLASGLARLPGRKLVFTNADEPYARRVLEALGVATHFAELHDIHAASFGPSRTSTVMN